MEEFRAQLDDNGTMIAIGTDGRNCIICVKIDSGCVVEDDWEREVEYVLANYLSEFFSKLNPRRDNSEE